MKQDYAFLNEKWFTQASIMTLIAAFFTYLWVTNRFAAGAGISVYWHLFYHAGRRAVFFYKNPKKIKLLKSSHAKRAFFKNYFSPVAIGSVVAISIILLIDFVSYKLLG